MNYLIIPVTKLTQNCSLIWCKRTKLATLIDPGGNDEKIKKQIAALDVILKHIILTHGHIDHVGAAVKLAQFYDVPIIGPGKEDELWLQELPAQSQIFEFNKCCPFTPDHWLREGEIINLGNITFQVLHCPGHTAGHISLFEKKFRLLISGDIIFRGSIGCSNFLYGNRKQLMNSIQKKLLSFGDNVIFIPGHGPISTLGYERINNPFLQKKL